jgi:hypothetical protein
MLAPDRRAVRRQRRLRTLLEETTEDRMIAARLRDIHVKGSARDHFGPIREFHVISQSESVFTWLWALC